jgi:hypothetical protein
VPKSKLDLSGVLLKLDRAAAHIETVREQILAFRERQPEPFGFRTERTPGPDNSVDYALYAIVRELPPRELAPIIGDAIHRWAVSAYRHAAAATPIAATSVTSSVERRGDSKRVAHWATLPR